MKKSLAIIFAASLGLTSCNNYKEVEGGTMLKVITDAGKEKIKEGDIVKLNFIQTNEKDSVMFSTYDSEQAQIFPVSKKMYAGDMNDILTKFGEGDSASFKINLDTIAKYSQQPKQSKDKYLVFTVKVEKVMKKVAGEADSVFNAKAKDFFMKDHKATTDKMKAAEPKKVATYIEETKSKFSTTASGLKYLIINQGSTQRPVLGDTLMVNYTGKLTKKDAKGNYKVFDTSVEKIAKEANVFQVGRPYGAQKMVFGGTIPGFTEGLQLLGKGGKATLLIPSNLGYGENGAPQAGITPFCPIVFDVEIINIIKPKQAASPIAKK
ncbi:MAG: FKBP-type peptidyl-prolyl cis-trans isomerase [Sphingobacteriaceae bacterium]|nr:FKBP-type peptidyl-prolyl cis-trans isomerase [Sphingobacteriaceae bacterium]